MSGEGHIYLGLSASPELIEAAKGSYDRWGFGLSSVRFICGTQQIHKNLEAKIAGFMGAHGRGAPEYHGAMDRVDILTGTFGKALGGASGGYTAARQPILELCANAVGPTCSPTLWPRRSALPPSAPKSAQGTPRRISAWLCALSPRSSGKWDFEGKKPPTGMYAPAGGLLLL